MVANPKKYNQVENIIRRSKTLILNVKLLGADTSHAKELLDNAKSALDQGDYNTAIDFAKKSMVEVISLKKQVKAGEISKPTETPQKISTDQAKPLDNSNTEDSQVEPVQVDLDNQDNQEPKQTYSDPNQNEVTSETNAELKAETQIKPNHTDSTSVVTSSTTTHLSTGADKLSEEIIKKFEESFSYLVEENRANNCFKIFSNFVSKGLNGLCICRINPNIIKRKYQIIDDRSTVLWLTDRESSQEATISPSLESMIYVAEEFIDKNENEILLLDGLEYLISNNSFNPVLRFIRRLIDKIYETTSILRIGLSPKAINEQELKLLERELNPIIL